MPVNLGSLDRLIRLVAGVVLVIVPFIPGLVLAPVLQWGLPVIGVVLIATAFLRFCPIYRVLGLSTNKAR
ncbi:DUF2892 domain-containing protein [Devosia sp.]|uniref:YgaP family membrane protein n=1 Tax=Devosia sp. TaxID=1871048 RepID=UPI002AFE65B1|nr:DUF2892 domain-containing protein [Devosia sp.]